MGIIKDKYINPFTDFGFKKIFGEEINKDLLIDFLNELLKGKENIKDLTFKKNEQLGPLFADRRAIFDLYCESDTGEKFIVELQKARQDFYKDRSVYYSTFPIQEQAIQGEWDYKLKAVYTIGILDFVFNDEDKDKVVVIEVKLMDTNKKAVFYDKLTYIYLQMPNFNKTEEELETHWDKWLYILKYLPKFQERPQKLQERIFDKLFRIAEISKFTNEEHYAYIDSLKVYWDLKAVLGTAVNEGWHQGWEKGKEEGREEGMIAKSQLFALKALKKGYPIEEIMDLTGLSNEEIEDLEKSLNNESSLKSVIPANAGI